MAVPKKRTSVSRKGLRRAGHTHKISGKTVTNCATTGEPTLPHCVSPSGYYKGKRIFTPKAELKAAAEEGEE